LSDSFSLEHNIDLDFPQFRYFTPALLASALVVNDNFNLCSSVIIISIIVIVISNHHQSIFVQQCMFPPSTFSHSHPHDSKQIKAILQSAIQFWIYHMMNHCPHHNHDKDHHHHILGIFFGIFCIIIIIMVMRLALGLQTC
jgi:hypothetical protein